LQASPLSANGPGACSPARNDRVGLPILIVLDQNRWTGVGIANALLENILPRAAWFPGLLPTGRLNFEVNGHSIDLRGPDIQMKLSFVVSLLVAASFAAYGQQAMPRMISVDPPNGKKGD